MDISKLAMLCHYLKGDANVSTSTPFGIHVTPSWTNVKVVKVMKELVAVSLIYLVVRSAYLLAFQFKPASMYPGT